MDVFVSLLLFSTFGAVRSDTHTLQYIYTALSKPVEMPGIYDFTAMGILDHRPIDHYNSKDKVKKSMQDWMEENMDKDYWTTGTKSRKIKEKWFEVNVNILIDRMNHNKSEVHILQWMHGCKVEISPGVLPKFVRGFDQYGYDGEDFLSFDDTDLQWVAPLIEAQPTKKKWDSAEYLNQYTKSYLERECVDWLVRFLQYQDEQLSNATRDSPPQVFLLAKKSFRPGKLILMCLATEFFPKDVTMHILRAQLRLDEGDGVFSSGVRPNGMELHGKEETFQLRKTLEIEQSDTSEYSCMIQHRTMPEPLVKKWDGKCNCEEDKSVAITLAIVVTMLLFVALALALGLCYWFRVQIREQAADGRKSVDSGNDSAQDDLSNGLDKGQLLGQCVPLIENGLKLNEQAADGRKSVDSGNDSAQDDLSNGLDKGQLHGQRVPLLENGLKPDEQAADGRKSVDSGNDSAQDDLSNGLDKGQQGADVV